MELKYGRIPNPVREWDRYDPFDPEDLPGPPRRSDFSVRMVVSAIVVAIAGLMFIGLAFVVMS